MDASVKRDVWLVNAAGVFGTIYFAAAFGNIILLFVTQCLKIPVQHWALVNAVMPLAQVFHLVSAFLTEHLRRRKLLSLTCFIVSRFATPAITLLPFFTGETDTRFRLFYVAIALLARVSISAMGEPAWSSWIADIVPAADRGGFLARRTQINILASILASVGAGWVIDKFGPANAWGYVLTFGLAFLAGETDLIVHWRVPDRPMPHPGEEIRMLPVLAAPWRHSGFRNLMLQQMIVAFGDSCIGPFAVMYLYRELFFNATMLQVFDAFLMLCMALSLRAWCRVGDRIGYRTVYLITHTLYGFGMIYWWFLPREHFWIVIAIFLVMRVYFGIVNAGLTLTVGTLNFNTAPVKHRSIYFAQITVVNSISMTLGALFGTWVFLHTDPLTPVMFLGTKLTAVHVLVGIFALFRLLTIRLFFNRIPDARSEAALPRLSRLMQVNPLRVLPMLLEFPAQMTAEERAQHIQAMVQLVPVGESPSLDEAVKTVLRDRVRAEEEFYGIIGRERLARGRGLARMLDEAEELARPHLSDTRARAAANRIRRLYEQRHFAGCLRTVRRLAHLNWIGAGSEIGASALSVIDAIAESGAEPEEDAVLLAIYAYLQILREPASPDGGGGAPQ